MAAKKKPAKRSAKSPECRNNSCCNEKTIDVIVSERLKTILDKLVNDIIPKSICSTTANSESLVASAKHIRGTILFLDKHILLRKGRLDEIRERMKSLAEEERALLADENIL